MNPFRCQGCGFLYYFNPAVAGAAFILREDGQALFIRRAKDPAKGKLGLVGGFVDPGESAEEGLRREILEEVGIEVGPLEFLLSHPNRYLYQDVEYPVVDLFFVTQALNPGSAAALDGVDSFSWLDLMSVDPAEMAFTSMQAALRHLQARRG